MKKQKILVNLNQHTPIEKQTIFFGKYNGFQRYDIYKNSFAKIIERSMRQAFWTPEEISLVDDRENFKSLPPHIQEVLIHNLLFQTLMDSAQNRGLDSVMSELVTQSEWEAVFKSQAYFELIHSLSYSHIIREMFSSDATQVFDRIYKIKEIKHRTDKEIDAYDEIRELIKNDAVTNTDENKKKILRLLIHIFFLEGLKFYISFMVTYTINSSYKDAIPGITRIIKLINFDEDMHVAVVGGLIGILRSDSREGFSELFNNGWFEDECYKIVNNIVNDELEWGKFLLSFGPINSLTIEVFTNFMKYYANERLSKLQLDPLYKVSNDLEVINWFKMYKDINKDNTAQQEATAINYNIGTMNNDMGNNDILKIFDEIIKTNSFDADELEQISKKGEKDEKK